LEVYDYDTIREAERQASRWAFRRWFQDRRDRLFPLPEMDLTSERARVYLEDAYWRQPVAVISSGSDRPNVGIFWGFSDASAFMSGNFLYAVEWVLGHFGHGYGTSTRGSHLGIMDMFRLPESYDIFIPPEDNE
jgi:hypothetical protein